MTKVHFVTFADGTKAFRAAGRRLCRQADDTGLFAGKAECWSLARLNEANPEFISTHRDYLSANPKGMGNYIWKPMVLLEALNSVNQGDIVLMLDSGCQFNINEDSIQRFCEYLEMTKLHQALFMQINDNSFGFTDLTDNAWTKNFTLNALDKDSVNRMTNQIQSGIIFMVSNKETKDFVNEWYQNCWKDNYALLTSPIAGECENPTFIGHRWEQSILSLMVKSRSFKYIPDETYWFPTWYLGRRFPIWAMRNRTGGDAARRSFFDKLKFFTARVEGFLRR